MTLKPEDRKRLMDALVAFLLVIFSIAGSMVADALTDIGEELPINVSPLPAPEEPLQALGTTHFTDLDYSGLLYPGFADLTVSTAGQSLTPEYTVYALDSSGAISMTLTACSNDGQPLVLIGDDANTITVNDSNIRTSDGNALTVGQYDIIVMMCQDTEWLEWLKLANQ